ncbi:MAG: hypothetical protein GX025_01070 [Clostridiales bacterium]|nr:hypothetical protein [Clostridiales bacterium]
MKRTDFLTRAVSLLLFGALTLYLGIYLFRSITNDVRYAPAVHISLTESSEASGIIIRDETLVESSDRFLSVSAKDGSLLAVGDVIAVAYANETALERASGIRELELKKQYINSVLTEHEDSASLTEKDEAIKNAVLSLSSAAARKETDRLSTAVLQLSSLVMQDPDTMATQVDLNLITQELNSLYQTAASDTLAIRAKKSGLFSSAADGYEHISPHNLTGLSSSGLRSLLGQAREVSENVRGKLCSANEWFFAAIVSEKIVAQGQEDEGLAVGKAASLDFGRYYGKPLSATVVSISPSEQGECAVVFRCTRAALEMLNVRRVSAEIIFDTHEGIRVPKKAVYADEDGSFVYTLTGLQAEKKYIEIVWETEDYYLAGFSLDASGLRVGNEIILTSKPVYDGKVMD